MGSARDNNVSRCVVTGLGDELREPDRIHRRAARRGRAAARGRRHLPGADGDDRGLFGGQHEQGLQGVDGVRRSRDQSRGRRHDPRTRGPISLRNRRLVRAHHTRFNGLYLLRFRVWARGR